MMTMRRTAAAVLFGFGLATLAAPTVAGASVAGASSAAAVNGHPIVIPLGTAYDLVLLPPDPCSPAATEARRCIDVIPGVVQVDKVSAAKTPDAVAGSPIVIPLGTA